MVSQKKEYIFFDIDDTLVDTSSTIMKRIEKLLCKYPVSEGGFYIHNLLSNPDREIILANQYKFSRSFWRDYEKLRKKIKVNPIGDIRSKLEDILSKGFTLGIITNSPYDRAVSKLKRCGLDNSFFKGGVYSHDRDAYIKDPIVFDSIKNRNSILYIGDSLEDYRFSINSKVNFFGVCTGLFDRNSFLKSGLEDRRIFNSIQEVTINEKAFSS